MWISNAFALGNSDLTLGLDTCASFVRPLSPARSARSPEGNSNCTALVLEADIYIWSYYVYIIPNCFWYLWIGQLTLSLKKVNWNWGEKFHSQLSMQFAEIYLGQRQQLRCQCSDVSVHMRSFSQRQAELRRGKNSLWSLASKSIPILLVFILMWY